MRRLLFLAAALLMAIPAAAQVNIERLRPDTGDGLRVTLDGDFSLRTGNAELFEFSGSGRVDYFAAGRHSFVLSNMRYARRDGIRFRNTAFAHVRHTHPVSGPVAGEVFAQVERDAFTLLQSRSLVGGGLRVTWHDGAYSRVAQGLAIMGEHEVLNQNRLPAGEDHISNVVRASTYLTLRLRLAEQVRLVNTAYLQPRLDDPADFRALHEAALVVNIGPVVAFQSSLNLRYDSRPPSPVGSLDLTVRNGLVLRF
jgi:hypothetical protein